MKKRGNPQTSCCGNCIHHSAYQYPRKIFCLFRFLRRKDPVVATLDICENWQLDYQECFCVQEASSK